MDIPIPSIPIWAIVLAGLCLVGLFASFVMGFFAFLFKVGVAINESRRPPHIDAGDYRLSQGHEVRAEGNYRSGRRDED